MRAKPKRRDRFDPRSERERQAARQARRRREQQWLEGLLMDIIRDFIDRMLAADPAIRTDVADRVLYRMRVEYGGLWVTIPKAPAETKEIGLRLGLLDPASLPERTRRRYRRQ